MKAFGRFLIGLLLVANLAFLAALSLHVVVGPGRLAVLPKGQLTLIDSYANTARWSGKDDLNRHAALVARLVDAGRTDLLPTGDARQAASAVSPAQAVTGTVKVDAPAQPQDRTVFDFDNKSGK